MAYRLVAPKWAATTLSGEGARLYGGAMEFPRTSRALSRDKSCSRGFGTSGPPYHSRIKAYSKNPHHRAYTQRYGRGRILAKRWLAW